MMDAMPESWSARLRWWADNDGGQRHLDECAGTRADCQTHAFIEDMLALADQLDAGTTGEPPP